MFGRILIEATITPWRSRQNEIIVRLCRAILLSEESYSIKKLALRRLEDALLCRPSNMKGAKSQ